MQDSKQVYMVLTNGFDPDVRVYKEARYLVQKGFRVTILCWDRKCEYKNIVEETIDNIIIKRFPILSQPGTGMKQLLPYFKYVKSVRKYLKYKKYTYLHCHDFDGILVGMFTKGRKQKKITFDMHEIYNNYAYAKNIFFKKIFNYILKKVNYIIYVNDEQIKQIQQTEKLIYLPNYPELNMYVPIEKEINPKIRINYIGALRDYSSLKCLIEISKRSNEFEIGIYGTGVCYETIEKECENLPVKLYGKYNGIKESGNIYRNTDILYCSYDPGIENWRNAYPVKLYESIITRTPIIVTKNTKVGDFVKKNNIGECIEYGNVDEIIKAVYRISKNYSKYVSNLRNMQNRYSWEKIGTNLNKIYK